MLEKDEGIRPKAEEEKNYPRYKPTHTTPTTSTTMTHFFLPYPHFWLYSFTMTNFLYVTHIFGFTRSFRLVFTFNFILFRSCWETGQGPRSKDITHRAEKGRNLEYQKEEAGYKYIATSRGGRGTTTHLVEE